MKGVLQSLVLWKALEGMTDLAFEKWWIIS